MEKIKDVLKSLSGKWKYIILGILVFLAIIMFMRVIRSVDRLSEDMGGAQVLSLEGDAFEVIDDTEIMIDDGISDKEAEKILNNYKLGQLATEDGELTDSKKNAQLFNELYNISTKLTDNISHIFSEGFFDRIGNIWKQHKYKLGVKYYQQRDTPKVGNIICVPTSARILLSGLGYEVKIEDLLEYFKNDPEVIQFARDRFGKWVEKYIREGKLYQITGIFAEGLNRYMDKHYPEFPYELGYNYWDVDKIAKYVDKYGLMSATFFPRYVMEGKRKGGHMITITKVYRDYNGVIVGFGINDPFGNPNVGYRGQRGYDGKDVIIDYETMTTVMKTYYDDHGYGSKNLYRVVYFRDKD